MKCTLDVILLFITVLFKTWFLKPVCGTYGKVCVCWITYMYANQVLRKHAVLKTTIYLESCCCVLFLLFFLYGYTVTKGDLLNLSFDEEE